MQLTKSQSETLRKIKNAPQKGNKVPWWMITKNEAGQVVGKFNSATLRALETKGFIHILKNGGRGPDTVILNK